MKAKLSVFNSYYLRYWQPSLEQEKNKSPQEKTYISSGTAINKAKTKHAVLSKKKHQIASVLLLKIKILNVLLLGRNEEASQKVQRASVPKVTIQGWAHP